MKLAYGVFLVIHHSTCYRSCREPFGYLCIMWVYAWGVLQIGGACVAAYVCAHTVSAVSGVWV